MKDSRSSSLALLPLAAIESLLQLFQSQSEELSFPGVSKEALEEQLAVIKEKNDAVADAEAALAEARDQLALAGEDVLQLAKKAHAYLSVYAQDQPDLSAELQKVKLSESSRASKGTRKKRAPASSSKKQDVAQEGSSEASSAELASDAASQPSLSKATARKSVASVVEQVSLEGAMAAE